MELVAQALRVERGGKTLVERLDVTFASGQVCAILGPNGAGKSSLLLTLAGVRAASSGTLELDGRPLEQWRARERALRLAWQGHLPSTEFGYTVSERLSLVPSRSRSPLDAMHQLELEQLGSRRLYELSAGERQRVELAALWLRDSPIWLLDEPTAHLDLRHQVRWLESLQNEAAHGRTILVALHDLTQAHAVADRALLLSGDGAVRCGAAASLLQPRVLENLYRTPLQQLQGTHGPELLPEYPHIQSRNKHPHHEEPLP